MTAQKLANSLLTVKHSAERKSVLKPAKCLKLPLNITPPQHFPNESKNLAAVKVIQKVSTAEIKSLNSVLLHLCQKEHITLLPVTHGNHPPFIKQERRLLSSPDTEVQFIKFLKMFHSEVSIKTNVVVLG